MNKSQKGFIVPLLIIIAVLLIGVGFYISYKNKKISQSPSTASVGVNIVVPTSSQQTASNDLISKIMDWSSYTTIDPTVSLIPSDCNNASGKTWQDYYSRILSDKGSVKIKKIDSSGLTVFYSPNYLHWTTQEFLSYDCMAEGSELTAYPDKLLWIDDESIAVNNLTGDPASDKKLIDEQTIRQADIDLIKAYFQAQAK